MKYRTTVEADRDIAEIYVLGADQFGVPQSERYIDDLFSTFELLDDNPRMARERRELNPPMRLHPYHAHMIAYMIRDENILIVRVLHGREDWESLFV
ncbi:MULTISPECIES: type II toxin-antitoxin system RelE/ParE family toxin [Rhizobium]|uniref:Toxin n=1 Tax=Rhizobium changzhiense TaxID=2692317 RepID=A0A7Z0ZUX7_9HYPH|nr:MULTISPECIES: type II toxin-antitoxin system RelE/ParE family toxin [Rhizobium]MBA5801365.1 type II toxin-antitoxin system RelE/ParE family toxin [Rhizobium changzhiense]MCH4548020.1 type II toxin-antitoxin system RelE/ParE family toxin [Rhizobium changzhiense]MCV9945894.1 type II toxin-antitoxin system RelE/ParE family toxin [Rhizobium sp. BT-175]MCW0019738.1 type II toxin-antitoxin system RelE/ParE family toxin [Rhizobium sp. BT-226]NZD64856.1 type II toxin-antitoxin system RelE/ParE fami